VECLTVIKLWDAGKLSRHELDVVPRGQLIARHAHGSDQTVLAKVF